MISAAQVILATETRRIRENPTLVANDAETLHLVAASRIFGYAGADPDVPEADRNQLLHLAALGYAAHGNFPAARATARTLLDQEGRTENELVALGVAAPSVIPDLLRNAARGSGARELLEVLAFNSRSREPEDSAVVAQKIVERFPTVRDPYESTLLMLAVTAAHVRNVFSLVRSDARLPIADDYLDELVQSGIRTLLPPQYRVINEGRLFEAPGNVAISLPTSTGKTLLGEMMLMRDLGSEPGMVVYVAPYVALGSQIRRVLRDHFPKSVRITPLIGGYTTEISLEPSKEREVVIATPERLDSLLRSSPDLAEHVRCVVIDEAHHLGSGERGVRLEGILTRLRLLQEKSARLRLVLLSAVLDNIETLEGWLGSESFVYRDTWQPTARRLSVWFDSGALVWFAGSDVLTRMGKKADDVIGQYQLPWPYGGIVPNDQFQIQRRQKEDLNRNAAYLARSFSMRTNNHCCVCVLRERTLDGSPTR
jgi:helicase